MPDVTFKSTLRGPWIWFLHCSGAVTGFGGSDGSHDAARSLHLSWGVYWMSPLSELAEAEGCGELGRPPLPLY